MILADTSAWVEYDRASGSPAHQRVRELIATEGPLAVTEPVVMELAGGARSSVHETALRRLLARFELLNIETPLDFDLAARMFRRCRTRGVTPRGFLDCMVVAVASRHDALVLAHDVDLARICGVVGVELDDASLR